MSYPAVSFAQYLDNATREELEQLTALLQGYLSVEHNEEGKHTAITATSITTTDATVNEDLTVTRDTRLGKHLKLFTTGVGALGGTAPVRDVTLSGATLLGASGTSLDRFLLNVTSASSTPQVAGLVAPTDIASDGSLAGAYYLIVNDAGADFDITHDQGASVGISTDGFYTPKDLSFRVYDGSSVLVAYDSGVSRWRIVGASTPIVHGTWTPAISFGGSTTGVTYSTQTGEYSRVGNLVTVTLHLVLTSNGTGTGSALIGGLPFASDLRVAAPFNYANCASATGLKGVIVNSDISVQVPGATGDADATHATITDTAVLLFGATYRI